MSPRGSTARRLARKRYNQVNESLGYGALAIITAREVRLDESDN